METIKTKEEQRLILLARSGDEEAKNKLISSSMKIVSDYLLKWNQETGNQINEDMMQEANLAMLGTVQRFVKGKSDPSFYRLSLKTSVMNALGEMMKSAETPFSLREDRMLRNSSSIKSAKEFDVVPYGEEEEDACKAPWDYCVPHPEDAACRQEVRERVTKLLGILPVQERYVIKRRFGIDSAEYSRQEIARMLGLRYSDIRKLESLGLHRLRRGSSSLREYI